MEIHKGAQAHESIKANWTSSFQASSTGFAFCLGGYVKGLSLIFCRGIFPFDVNAFRLKRQIFQLTEFTWTTFTPTQPKRFLISLKRFINFTITFLESSACAQSDDSPVLRGDSWQMFATTARIRSIIKLNFIAIIYNWRTFAPTQRKVVSERWMEEFRNDPNYTNHRRLNFFFCCRRWRKQVNWEVETGNRLRFRKVLPELSTKSNSALDPGFDFIWDPRWTFN